MRPILLVAVASVVLAGCSGGTAELSKKEDSELRNNFARALTPEELAMMGKSKPAAAPPKVK